MPVNMQDIITRAAATKLGLPRYFKGVACAGAPLREVYQDSRMRYL